MEKRDSINSSDEVRKSDKEDVIKIDITLIGLDEIEKKKLTATKHINKSQTAITEKNKKQTIKKTKTDVLKQVSKTKTDVHKRTNKTNDWLTFRTTLAPNIRLQEQFVYDKTGILTVRSGFMGDKRRINLPVVKIE